ncbi:hypothetical protein EMIHUDRAFT_123915, partial [Emiliania huxleyi CCMP1516]|uniref:Uncharacterized protein n=2 Tax=Emiliania huxleyi TaxID=2903 RepID=A0A0D3JA09_EMIH1
MVARSASRVARRGLVRARGSERSNAKLTVDVLHAAGALPAAAPAPEGDYKHAAPFDEALHQLNNATRPISEDDVVTLCALVRRLAMLAGDDADLWKALVLTVVRRRFHSRSPEARADAKSEAEDEAALGDGERLIFYVAFVVILHLLREDGHHGLAAKAASVLCSLAPLAGGSRDTCTLLELAAYDAL